MLRQTQFPEDAGPMAHPVRPDSYVEINNFYTATVYEKGAEVVRMMQTLVGREGFARGMTLYFERHDGQAVTCDDFAQAIADANPGSAAGRACSTSSSAGTARPARRAWWRARITTRTCAPTRSSWRSMRPLARPGGQAALRDPGGDGAGRPGRPRAAAATGGRNAAGGHRAGAGLREPKQHFDVRRHRRRAGAFAAARLFRAGDPAGRARAMRNC